MKYLVPDPIVPKDVPAVPEPGTLLLLGCGVAGAVGVARRRRNVVGA